MKKDADPSRAIWIEVGAVLMLICAPTLANVGCSLIWGGEYQKLAKEARKAEYRSVLAYDSTTFESMVVRLRYIPIILFLIWRSGLGWSHFGIVKPELAKDVILGLGLWLVLAMLESIVILESGWHFSWTPFRPVSIPVARGFLLLGNCCAIGFVEELGIRAYLIPRMEQVTGSTWKSVLFSIVFFRFVHLQKDAVGVIHSLVAATVWGIAFTLRRRIWPLAISHAIADFIVATHLAATVGN